MPARDSILITVDEATIKLYSDVREKTESDPHEEAIFYGRASHALLRHMLDRAVRSPEMANALGVVFERLIAQMQLNACPSSCPFDPSDN